MTVVYIDSVFVLNALMDAIVLLATAHLTGIPPKRGRYFLAALFGGVYAAAVFLPWGELLASVPGKMAAGLVMTAVAFGGERRFLRIALVFFGVSCGLAGCVMGLGMMTDGLPVENGIFYTNVDAGVLLVSAAAAYVVLSFVFRASAGKGIRGELVPVRLAWGERQIHLRALCDTGNVLKDPVTGRPILVAEIIRMRELFPPELRPLLTPDNLRMPADLIGRLGKERVRFRLIPYQAVGVSGGMLLAVRLDWGEVAGKRYERLVAALSPTELGDGFAALWGELERSGSYGKGEPVCTKAAGAVGFNTAAERPLHRRK